MLTRRTGNEPQIAGTVRRTQRPLRAIRQLGYDFGTREHNTNPLSVHNQLRTDNWPFGLDAELWSGKRKGQRGGKNHAH